MSEQDRADQLARDIERLIAGEHVPGHDPLLEVAASLARLPMQPGPQAVARFEQRLDQWFGTPSAPPVARHVPGPVIIGTLVTVGVVILALLVGRPILVPPAPTPTALPTGTPTASPTLTPTATGTPTITPTDTAPAASPTPPSFSRIIINGQVDSIQNGIVVILGQQIRIDGSIGKLCAGDLVRVEVSVDADGTYHASRDAITVESSACTPAPAVAPPRPAPPSSGDGDHHHDD